MTDIKNSITRMSLLGVIVCSTGTEDEALAWVRAESPAGTRANWCKIDNPTDNQRPVPCANGGGATHYLFEC